MNKKNEKTFIHHNIQFIRECILRLSREEFAKQLGVANVEPWEAGRAAPKDSEKIKIADLANISLDRLMRKHLTLEDFKTDSSDLAIDLDGYIRGNDIKIKAVELEPRQLAITTTHGKENIEWVPEKAAAGYLNGFADPQFVKELPKFQLPFLPTDKTYRAFQIKGDSMPPLPSGSIVVCDYVENWEVDIKTGRTYIVVSESNGIVYKRAINEIHQKHSLTLRSDNPIYPDFTVAVGDIKEIWRARALIINSEQDGMCCFFTKFDS